MLSKLGEENIKEIGGYLSLEKNRGKEFYGKLTATNLGRTAFYYVLSALGIKRVFIPRYLCGSMARAAERFGAEVIKYSVGEDFLPTDGSINASLPLKGDDAILIVNYFGFFGKKEIKRLKTKYGNVILDNSHAFYFKPIKGIPTVYSAEKFFGVTGGGYAYLDEDPYLPLEKELSYGDLTALIGRFETDDGAKFFAANKDMKKSFITRPMMAMSPFNRNVLCGVDYKTVKRIRESNFDYLKARLDRYNILKIPKIPAPYAYPFYIGNGKKVRRQLAENKIYVPLLWSKALEEEGLTDKERDFAENILPLPVDQRYCKKDMATVVAVLKKIGAIEE